MTGAQALARWKTLTQAAVRQWTGGSDDTRPAADQTSVDLERWRQSLPSVAPALRSIHPSPMGVVR